MTDWKKKTVLIVGAARQGQALARYLSKKGANVILNDMQSEEILSSIARSFENTTVQCAFGSHPTELLEGVDLVSLSGGIPLTNPMAMEAAKRKIPITNDTQVFMEAVKAPVIGITGSAGKTTTTSLVGKMAQIEATLEKKAWVGGNIGQPLVEYLDEIEPDDIVILEISSFQLEQITISPHIGAILNITPNHLDRHKTLEAYTLAKQRLLIFQRSDDIAILNREDPGAWSLVGKINGSLLTFGKATPTDGLDGTFLQNDSICYKHGDSISKILSKSDILLRGEHNLMNVLAACTIAHAAGFSPATMQKAVQEFSGVSHRLEFVRRWRDVDWYNDSIATAPERTIAAVRSFNQPIVLLLGGRDKDLPWQELATLIHQHVDHVVVFGESAVKILSALEEAAPKNSLTSICRVNKMNDAIQAASEIARPGDVVLLSPGGTSFDEFKDFEERGERYREWVKHLS